jgi:hypothetical protein
MSIATLQREVARLGALVGRTDADALADPADPVGWMRDALGADPWEKQVEIAEAVRDHRRTAVKSCHASGKSYLAARIVLWFLHAFPHGIAITTAPTQR